MQGVEIEQIADHDLRPHVAQRLRALVFIPDHRAHRFTLLQQHLRDRTPYRATRPAAPVTRMGIAMRFLLCVLPYAKRSRLDNPK
jgi:hypothetical protein